ncbi:MAG: YesL family protein [Lachnospiraceae bacterium]|nr:YesL family protein [Lachnospiraceae bacterium]
MSEKIFQSDNLFFRIMDRCADYVILNLLFVLTSVPVVTVGASISAIHAVLNRMDRDEEGSIPKTYLRMWAENFKQSTRLWAVLLAAAVVIGGDLYIVFTADGGSLQAFLLIALTIMAVLWCFIFTWSFVNPEFLKGSIRDRVKAVFSQAVRHLPATLGMIAVEAVPFAVLAVSFGTFAAVMEPAMFLCWFSVSGKICHILAKRAM